MHKILVKITLIYVGLIYLANMGSTNSSHRKNITLAGAFSLTGIWKSGALLTSAIMAVDYVNNRSDLLPDYYLDLQVADTQVNK